MLNMKIRGHFFSICGIASTLVMAGSANAGTTAKPWDGQWEKAREYEADGSWNLAEMAYRRTMDLAKASHASSDTIREINIKIATVYVREKKYPDAEPIYRELMKSDIVNPENRHSQAAREGIVLFTDLGDTYAMAAGSEQCLKHAVEIDEKLFGPYDDRLLRVLNELDNFYNLHQRYAEAQSVLKKRIEILEKDAAGQASGGTEKAKPGELARSLIELGSVQATLKRYADAEASYVKAYPIFLKEYGPTYVMTASTAREAGYVMMKQRQTQSALQWSQRAVQLRRMDKGQQYPLELARDLTVLGRVFEQQGNVSKAEQLYRESISVIQKNAGANSVELVSPRECLANLLKRTGKAVDGKSVVN
jgi:tetratricopeptide (TPR) repeat protein